MQRSTFKYVPAPFSPLLFSFSSDFVITNCSSEFLIMWKHLSMHTRLEVWNGFIRLCYAALSNAEYAYRKSFSVYGADIRLTERHRGHSGLLLGYIYISNDDEWWWIELISDLKLLSHSHAHVEPPSIVEESPRKEHPYHFYKCMRRAPSQRIVCEMNDWNKIAQSCR